MIYALSKIDLLENGDLKRIERWSEDIDFVISDMTALDNPMIRDLSIIWSSMV